jgi:hypothetical protein
MATMMGFPFFLIRKKTTSLGHSWTPSFGNLFLGITVSYKDLINPLLLMSCSRLCIWWHPHILDSDF